MKRVFADAHFFIALLNRRDAFHGRAEETYRDMDFQETVTTAWVLAELADGMSSPGARTVCRDFIRGFRRRKDARIIEHPECFWRGFDLYSKRPDKEWSLTDCISFIVMSDEGLTEALTGDRHFEQAGFTALLRD